MHLICVLHIHHAISSRLRQSVAPTKHMWAGPTRRKKEEVPWGWQIPFKQEGGGGGKTKKGVPDITL